MRLVSELRLNHNFPLVFWDVPSLAYNKIKFNLFWNVFDKCYLCKLQKNEGNKWLQKSRTVKGQPR